MGPRSCAGPTTWSFVQEGVLAVQPSSSSALVIRGDAVTSTGAVREPGVPYRVDARKLEMTQSGNRLTATLCGRTVGLDL